MGGKWLGALAALAALAVVAVVPASGGNTSQATDTYIVQLAQSPAVAYDGDIAGYERTRPAKGSKLDPNSAAVKKYAGYLDAKHSEVLAKVGGKDKIYDYRYAYNGFAAKLTAKQATRLEGLDDVLSVEKAQEVTMDTATTPAFLGLTDPADGLWTKGVKGEGVVIGIVDSGVWPESKSFSDRTGTGPTGQAGKLAYQELPGWHGKCTPGESFNASMCNQKLIGAQYFCASRGCDTILPHEFLSPRDYNGHGTHTASTAGGNEGVPTTGGSALFGTVNGIAPRARIAAYKVCWDNGAGGCGANSGDSVAAIDQAVADGVDVINYSISGTQTNYLDSVEVAYLFAADAGVFVATSAGNSGPTATTVAHISPWLASVAAGTHNRSGTATITLGDNSTYTGASLTPGVGPAPVVLASDVGVAGAHPDLVRQCFSDDGTGHPVLDSAKVTGKIVVCERGGPSPVAANARLDKSLAVKNAGGVGMILANVTVNSLNADLHSIPSIHVNLTDGAAIKAYVTSAGAAATATLGQAVVNTSAPAPDVASFSSRGPSIGGGGDILKPDFMAPGQDILAAVAPPGNAGKDFDIYSGTSMSSPHVAGIGALLTQAHPEWSPAAMRSAIATTADALSRAGLNNPFNTGSGHVRPNLAVNPGLVYEAGFADYLAFLKGQKLCCAANAAVTAIDASDLNQPSIAIGDVAGTQTVTRTVTNVGGVAATYTATVQAPAGFTVQVSPTSFDIAAGATKSYTVSVTRVDAPFGTFPATFRFGALTWTDGTHSARSPIALRAVPISAPTSFAGTGTSGSTSFGIRTGYDGTLSYVKRGLIPAVTEERTVQDDPTSNFATGNPLGNQGIQVHDVVVPAGTTYARFATFDDFVDGVDDDLDMYVYRVDPDGSDEGTDPDLVLVGNSGGGTAQEEVNLVNPPAATYKVFVHGWETDGPDAVYTLFSWVLGTADAGNMTVTGPTTAVTGATGTVNLSWAGLDAGKKYLGAIAYNNGTSDIGTTIVRIDG